MKNASKFAALVILFVVTINHFSASAKNAPDIPVEVTEIKELGASASDETKTIIEIRWRTNSTLNTSVSSYKLTLSVTYADGTVFTESKKADAKAISARFEVPGAKISNGKPAANIKKVSAIVLAVLVEKSN